MTSAHGVPIDSRTSVQTVGPRGPMLLQDVVYQEELAHFDRERIAERVVHAKGAGERSVEWGYWSGSTGMGILLEWVYRNGSTAGAGVFMLTTCLLYGDVLHACLVRHSCHLRTSCVPLSPDPSSNQLGPSVLSHQCSFIPVMWAS